MHAFYYMEIRSAKFHSDVPFSRHTCKTQTHTYACTHTQEYAAQCFMQARSPHDALRALSRRHDSAALTAALRLARELGHASVSDLEQRLEKSKDKETEKERETRSISAENASFDRFSNMPSVVSWHTSSMHGAQAANSLGVTRDAQVQNRRGATECAWMPSVVTWRL